MKEATVGIDIDGVLVDAYMYQTIYGSRYFGREPINPNTLDIATMFGVSKERAEEYLKHGRFDYITKVPSTSYINYLNQTLVSLHIPHMIITKRFEEDDPKDKITILLKDHTDMMIKRMFPKAKGIVYVKGNKLKAVKQYGIKMMIEDDVNNIEILRPYCMCIKILTPYNRDYEASNVVTANDLMQAAEFIKLYHYIKKGTMV